MTTAELPALLHSAFYRFVALAEPAGVAAALRVLGAQHGLQGSVVLAHEGISGTVAGAPAAVAAFQGALRDLNDGALRGMAFRHSACRTEPFGRWKVTVRPEIVALGLPADAALPSPDEHDASHLDPPAWRTLLERDDVVLLDNRNHFEYRLGHFRGAVDPQVHNFRDFVAFVQAHAPVWRAAGRPVAMYCTGGIRCDKTAPWLRRLGLDVFQLAGGVLNYFEQVDDAGADWQGECFVFDRRIALDCRLDETATTAEQVFDPADPDEAWRLRRARELETPGAVPPGHGPA